MMNGYFPKNKFIFTLLLLSFLSCLGLITRHADTAFLTRELPTPPLKADRILLQKSMRKLSLFHKGKVLRSYTVSLGFSPQGAKQQKGDGKTPEGYYYIRAKNPHSQFHRSLQISYPNEQDQKNARKNHVSPGDHIMIHGLKTQFSWLGRFHTLKDWTLGCIAVTNAEIEEIWELVDPGTPIDIEP